MASEVGIIALPVGLLMIAGELDISVGAVVPAASLTVAIISGHYGAPDIVGILCALGVGLLVGFVNGLLVTRTRVPSLILTIGTMFGVMGLTLGLTILIAGSTGVFIVPDPAAEALFGQSIAGMFQVTIVWWAAFILVIYYLLHLSPTGNWIFALGGDRESARNAGIPTQRLTIQLYMLSGFAAAFVGVCQVMTFKSAQVAAGQSFIFNCDHVRRDRGRGSDRRTRLRHRHRLRHDHLRRGEPGHLLHRRRSQCRICHHRRAAAHRRADQRQLPGDGAQLRHEEEVRAKP